MEGTVFFRFGDTTPSVTLPGRPIDLAAAGDFFFALVETHPGSRGIVRISPDNSLVRLGEVGDWGEIAPGGETLFAVRNGAREIWAFPLRGAGTRLATAAGARSLVPSPDGARLALFAPQDGAVEVLHANLIETGPFHVGRLVAGTAAPVWHGGSLYWIGAGGGGSAIHRWRPGEASPSHAWVDPWPVGPLASTSKGLLAFRPASGASATATSRRPGRPAASNWEAVFLDEAGAPGRAFPLPLSFKPLAVRSAAGDPVRFILEAEKTVHHLLFLTEAGEGQLLSEIGDPSSRRAAMSDEGRYLFVATRRGINRFEVR